MSGATVRLVLVGCLLAGAGCERIGEELSGRPKPPAPRPAPSSTPVIAPLPAPPAKLDLLRDLADWDAADSEDRRRVAEALAERLGRFSFKGLETFSAGGERHEIAVFVHEQSGLEFSLIPAGQFRMGSPDGETGRQADEQQHTVRLTRPFLIARTEVTQAAWQVVLKKASPSRNQGADLPVETLRWYDCDEFCGKTRLDFPTEAQWEYACRAGTRTRWCFGDDPSLLGDYAWHDANAGGTTHPVGRKRPNAFGLHDVHGNVFEWCRDALAAPTSEAQTDPVGPEGKEVTQRAVRGGCYLHRADLQRSAFRYRTHAGDKQAIIGFRPVWNLKD